MPDDIYNNDSSGSRGKYESDLQSFTYSVNRKEQIVVASEKHINELIKRLKEERHMDEVHARKEAAKIEATLQQNNYKKLAFQSRESYLKQKAYEMELAKQKLEDQKVLTKKFETDESKKRSLLRDYAKQQKLLDEERLKTEKEISKVQEISYKVSEEMQKKLGNRRGLMGRVEESKMRLEQAQKSFQDALKKETDIRAIAEYEKLSGGISKSTADSLLRAESDTAKAKADYDQAESTSKIVDALSKMEASLGQGLVRISESINSEVEKAIDTIKEFQPHVMARLQGSQRTYDDIKGLLSRTLAASPFVLYQDVLQNAVKAVELGIAYNIEERAFLGTIAEDIATTFDAFDSNLLRLIRLQQADSTAARMGMEAYLTKFLNNMFSDTSYLNNVYDAVSAALIDAQSVMPYQEATASEYILQKWFGSLYALGFSESAIQHIAKGINMLLTGDVQGLASDTAMQTLLAMSASRVESVNFADAMLEGLNSSQLNDLMLSMVTYLQEIAKNSDTRVVRSAFGDIFDMSMSDFASLQTLGLKDLSAIYESTLSYDQAYKELGRQLAQVPERLALSDMIHNLASNILFTTGENLAENPVTYATWLITDMIEQATGGIHLPAVSIFGNMIDLSAFTVEGLVKTGMVGLGLLPTMFQAISSASKLGGISPDIWGTWNANQFTSRGTGIVLNKTGVTSNLSGAQYISAGGEDIQQSVVSQAAAEAETSGVKGSQTTESKTINDIYALLEEQIGTDIAEIKASVVDESPAKTISGLSNAVRQDNDSVKVYIQEEQFKAMTTPNSPFSSIFTEEGQEEDFKQKLIQFIQSLMDKTEIIDVNVKNSDFDAFLNRYTYANM